MLSKGPSKEELTPHPPPSLPPPVVATPPLVYEGPTLKDCPAIPKSVFLSLDLASETFHTLVSQLALF